MSLCLALVSVAPSGCNQFAGAQQPPAPAPGAAESRHERSDEPIVEGETCTRTQDCPRGARCLDGRCQSVTRSYQGEVLAERGARALAVGHYQEAGEAFHAAEAAYRARQVPEPAAVACGLARALTALNDRGGGPNDQREATARALAACLSTAPPNSAVADQALAGLASLADRGLDVGALDRADAALMTGRDPRPTAENTHVRLTFTGPSEGSRATFRELVDGDAIRGEVTRCFLQWWETSRQNTDQGTLRVSYSRGTDDYDELMAPRLAVAPLDIAASAADAGANTHWLQCAANAIQTAAATLRWPGHSDRWAESIVIVVGPT